MDVQILKTLYENLESIDNFIILSDNNYDPDKKLLENLLYLFINNDLIQCKNVFIACDIIRKLIYQKNYKENVSYLHLAIKTNIYDIIETVIKSKININIYDLDSLNLIKNPLNIITLMIENGYDEKLKNYFIVNRNIVDAKHNLLKVLLIKYKNNISEDLLSYIKI